MLTEEKEEERKRNSTHPCLNGCVKKERKKEDTSKKQDPAGDPGRVTTALCLQADTGIQAHLILKFAF